MEGLEVIKQLVDSLTVSLTNILLKIESINPILTRLSEEMKDGKNVSSETIEAVKELKREILSYHESMVKLPATLQQIGDIHEMLKDIDEKIDAIKEKTDTIPDITTQVNSNNKMLGPVNKIANWIMTPVGIIVSLVGGVVAVAGIVQTFQWIIETFFSK